MNHYYLLFGPAMGFILGVFFAWFLMYSRIRLVEKVAAEEKAELKKEIADAETLRNQLSESKARLDENRAATDRLQMKLEHDQELLKNETQQRISFEEKAKHTTELEEKVAKLTDQVRELAVLRERTQKLEKENSNLLQEAEQLRHFETQLSQISEIKEIYNRTLEENQNLRNQDIARHLMAMKDGLQQSIKAFNSVMRMADNPLLTDTIEIQSAKTDEKGEASEESLSELEQLDAINEDTTELDKLEGVE